MINDFLDIFSQLEKTKAIEELCILDSAIVSFYNTHKNKEEMGHTTKQLTENLWNCSQRNVNRISLEYKKKQELKKIKEYENQFVD